MGNFEVFNNLFILEMANNHMGDVNHGLKIIKEFSKVCEAFRDTFRFAFKFQYRNLETFIHPEYRGCFEFKYVKRFSETNLTYEERKRLKENAKELGFITICTPFDEPSVDAIELHDYDMIKIGSCSLTDWPLLERVVKTNKPIIISTAGSSLEDIDKVVTFLQNREKEFSLMHCVGEYPTPAGNLQLNQIDLLKSRYAGVPIGYSTHEYPDNTDAIKIAIAKGAVLFERHVGLKTEKYELNQYSSTPEQIFKWLSAAKEAFVMCGIENGRYEGTEKERRDLRGLQRGVFASRFIKTGEVIDHSNTFLAIPNFEEQLIANDMSKYARFVAKRDINANSAIFMDDVEATNTRDKVLKIVNKIRTLLIDSRVALPRKVDIEISHHYGIDRFEEWGATIVNCINREYCKKLIVLLPGQKHPLHCHKRKEETFHVLYGEVLFNINGKVKKGETGDIIVVERGVPHSFSSEKGVIFEEISTTHYKDDSFYEDKNIMQNGSRKTEVTFWSDWLLKQNF